MLACFLTLFDTFWHFLTLFDSFWHANPCVFCLFCFLTRFDTQVLRNIFGHAFFWHVLTRTCIPLANGSRCQQIMSKKYFWHVLTRFDTNVHTSRTGDEVSKNSVKKCQIFFDTSSRDGSAPRPLPASRSLRPGAPMQLPSRRGFCASRRLDHGLKV